MAVRIGQPFVGREAERQALERHRAAACDGAGRVVLVTGEAGIGKTRVVAEAIGGPRTPGVFWGRCHEGGGSPAFWPWIEALRPLVAAQPAERLREALGAGAAELARLFPELAPGATDAARAAAAPGSAAARFRLFDAVATLLTALADEPLVLVLDDLHWADAESLLLLRFLGPEIRRRPVLIVATCREDELRAVPEAPHIRADLARLAERVALPGLTPDEIAAYARAAAGVGAAAPVVRAIHGATAGNAFFVTELVELLRRAGRLDAADARIDELDLPAGLRDAVLRRLDALDGEARRLLRIAALHGAEFPLDVVARAFGGEVRSVLELLEPAFAAGVVREPSPGGIAASFAHDLVVEALRAELAPRERREAHLALADALEALRPRALGDVAGDVARHLLAAAPLADPARIVACAARAGESALERLGYEEATAYFAQALDVARASGAGAEQRLDLVSRLAAARLAAGDDDGARNTAVEAARAARDAGDVRRFAHAAALASAARSETGQPDHEVVALLEEAERASADAPARDVAALRARVLPPLARELYFVDRERRLATSAEGLERARALGDASLLAAALGARHLALWEPGRAAERLALADEQLALAERTQDALLATHAHAWRIADLLELGRTGAANEGLRRYEALASRLRLPRLTWHVAVAQASRALRLGRLDAAERLAEDALATWQAGPQNNVLQFYAIQIFTIREEQGRLAELDDTLQAFAAGSALPAWHAALASLHATLGRRDEARRVLHELAARVDTLPLDGTWVPTMARLAHACDLVGEAEVAATLLPRLAPYAGDHAVIGAGVAYLGPVARWAGLLALAAGRFDEAVAHLEDALAANRRSGAPIALAHVQAALARALRARAASGDEKRAGELVRDALAAAHELGLGGLARQVGEAPAGAVTTTDSRAGDGAAAERSARGASVATLRREGDVWLVAHGGESVRLRDMKGIHCLAKLLREPGREMHALDVVGSDLEGDADAGELADPEARRAYRARLVELREELDEAEARNDVGRAERLRREIEALADELGRVVGLGGRPRRAGSLAERARLNATRTIRKAIERIAADCPRLGHHLSRSVKTGRICCYEEDPNFRVTWRVEDGIGMSSR